MTYFIRKVLAGGCFGSTPVPSLSSVFLISRLDPPALKGIFLKRLDKGSTCGGDGEDIIDDNSIFGDFFVGSDDGGSCQGSSD